MPLEDLKKTRLKKLENLKKIGINAYPSKSERNFLISQIIEDFNFLKEKTDIKLAGRLIAIREHGGSAFANLEDYSGIIQIYFKKDILGKDYDLFTQNIDLGDFLEVGGILFITKRGEKTLEVKNFKLISKAISPLPSAWYGLADVEERYRKRYLDLLMNKEVKKVFEFRSKIIKSIRNFLDISGFIEVETPILQILAGGAAAKPFKTKLQALKMNLYLRIAPELYLKRLIVGGFEKIYELGRNFRNEGMDRTHNPEFTMLELYAAYQDYNYLMNLTEQLFSQIIKENFGKYEIEFNNNQIIFNNLPWPRIEFETLVNSELGEDYKKMSLASLKKKFKELGIKADTKILKNKNKMIDEVFKKLAVPKIIQPTFIINHPIEISPLAKEMENENPKVLMKEGGKVERFQLIVGGLEIVNGFSELNNPLEQEKRFKDQEKMRKAGDIEAQSYDKDFIEALEYGMPPTAGLGIGIDRLIMLLTDSKTLKDVLFFPTMRPKRK